MTNLQLKVALVVALCHIFTLCLIYNCMPRIQIDSRKGSDLHHFVNNRTKGTVATDPYKLNWKAKDNVYFKKVRNSVQENKGDDIVIDVMDRDWKCDKTLHSAFQQIIEGIYIYSAYYDARNGTAFIRFIAAVSRTNTKEQLDAMLSCSFQKDKGNAPSVLHSRIVSYEMCENHKRRIGGWLLSCQVPSDMKMIPQKVRILLKKTENSSRETSKEICIISRDANLTRTKLKFGVCVPPLYGQVKAKSLIEFIEFNRILGGNTFMMYVESSLGSITVEVKQVLRYYEQRNIVQIMPWKLPFSLDKIWYHGQSLAINDCLYRNMNDFEYLAFVDIDEYIVPKGDLFTWSDILHKLNQSDEYFFKPMIGMSFKSTFYSEEFSRHVFSNEMTMTVRTNRTRQFSFRRNKVIVKPTKIFELGIHHVSKPFHESDVQNVMKVPTSTAYIHHYRTCVQEFGIQCQMQIEDFSVPNKYGQNIIDNYLKILFDITP